MQYSALCPGCHQPYLSRNSRTAVRKRIRRIFDDASPRQAAGATHRMQPHGAKVSEPFELCPPPDSTDGGILAHFSLFCNPPTTSPSVPEDEPSAFLGASNGQFMNGHRFLLFSSNASGQKKGKVPSDGFCCGTEPCSCFHEFRNA